MDLFQELLLAELVSREVLGLDVGAYTYVVECTAHRSERMLVFGSSSYPSLVCYWASGARRSSLQRAAQTIRELAARHEELRPALPDVLYAGEVLTRSVLVFPWYRGSMFNACLGSTAERTLTLRAALDILTDLHTTTCRPHRFDHQDYATYVDAPIDLLARYGVLNDESASRLARLAPWLKALVGRPVPTCARHGDFEFGNLMRCADGSFRILDWELAQLNGLAVLDLVHLLVAYGVNGLGLSYGEALYALFGQSGQERTLAEECVRQYRSVISFEPDTVSRLAALCALNDASSYLQRAPFIADPRFWSGYFEASEKLMLDDLPHG